MPAARNGQRRRARERAIAERRLALLVERHTLAGITIRPAARVLRETRGGRR